MSNNFWFTTITVLIFLLFLSFLPSCSFCYFYFVFTDTTWLPCLFLVSAIHLNFSPIVYLHLSHWWSLIRDLIFATHICAIFSNRDRYDLNASLECFFSNVFSQMFEPPVETEKLEIQNLPKSVDLTQKSKRFLVLIGTLEK